MTGTDTEVGKTRVAAGLCAWLRQQGRDVRPFKPVESGTELSGGVAVDSELLARCAGLEGPSEVNVYALPEPLAPVLAAERAGVEIEISRLDARFASLAERGTELVVEGAGGALVEVCRGVMVADLAQRWDLQVLIVAANRLGVLSHTLLTVEALLARGARVAGVVLNSLASGPGSVAQQTNPGELRATLPDGVALLGAMPYLPPAEQDCPEALASGVASFAPQLFQLTDTAGPT